MVGCWEALIMHTSCTTCSNDHSLCTGYHIISCLHIQKNCTSNLSLVIFDQLYS